MHTYIGGTVAAAVAAASTAAAPFTTDGKQ
jgi:hypothetical protein